MHDCSPYGGLFTDFEILNGGVQALPLIETARGRIAGQFTPRRFFVRLTFDPIDYHC
jgi:hypothetical protein